MPTRRLYYDDSFVREFSAEVLDCTALEDSPSPKWSVVLDQTAFYPTSGGQPNDLGALGGANLIDVRDGESEILHVVDRLLPQGAIQGRVDWVRRFDHMQQHSGQHLLSAIFQNRHSRPTVSFHLGKDVSTIDLRGPEPSAETLANVEREANELIFEDRPVNIHYGTAEELSALGVRKQVERTGVLRAIEIAGADLTPCGGTHVARTGQIGALLIRRCTKMRQDWRVEFVCGNRAVQIARRDFTLLQNVVDRLSCASEDVVATAERAIAERDAHFKAMRSLLQRLAEAEASILFQSSAPGADGLRVVVRIFAEGTTAEYLGAFAAQLAKFQNTIALLASSKDGHVVFAQHPSAGKDMNALLKSIFGQFGGKGGGSRDSARGKLADPSSADNAIEAAEIFIKGQET
jgi:alanyl-tRNA synthetase